MILQITINRTICILFLFLLLTGLPQISSGNTGSLRIFRVDVKDASENKKSSTPVKDFYINGGQSKGLMKSMVLDVYRDKSVWDRYSGKDIIFSIPVGKIKVYNVFENVATARIVSLTSSDTTPIIKYRTVMIGDYVIPKEIEKGPGILLPSSLLFNLNSWKLKPEAQKTLSTVYDTFNKSKDKDLIIEGHTCSIGKEKNNLELSKKRAQSVASFLKKTKGIPEQHIHIKHYGESSPIASNATPEGREKNRRVAIRFMERNK